MKKNKKKKETVAAEPTPSEEAAVQLDEVSSEPSDLPEQPED